MRAGMLALALGLLSLRFLPVLPPGWVLLACAALGLGLLLSRLYPAGFFLLGFAWACTSAQWALDDRLTPALDGRTLWLEGRVVGLPAVAGDTIRFELQGAVSRRGELPQLIRVAWRGGPQVYSGERWRLAVSLRRPHALVNPQSFDYEAWLLAQRIGATGTVKAGARLSEAEQVGAWRDALRHKITQVEAFGRGGGLAALVVGDGSGLSSEDWRLLQHTGTVHLMVISGQHVTLLAGILFGLVFWLARLGLWPRGLPWLPCACALALLGALGYAMLAGFEVPVRRACVMIALVLLWRLRFRHLGAWWPLLLALNLVLLAEPLAVLQPGFWLSFAAVAVLILVFAGRLGRWGWWRSLGRAQWTMAFGLLPAMLALGLPVSASGPLANLIAVPWVGVLVVPMALLGTVLLPIPWLGEGLLLIAGGLLQLLFVVLAQIANWLPAWLPAALPLWALVLTGLGAVLLLLPTGMPFRAPGLLLLLPALLFDGRQVEQGVAEVWMFDVGQGLSVLVRTQEHALLYDAGPNFGDFDVGERVVLPSLRALNLRELDTLLLSHADNDHAGGALAITRGLPVARVLGGEIARLPDDLHAEPCGQRCWHWDGVEFQVWRWPHAGNGNQSSCVLLVEAGSERLLLAGDIDSYAERALLASAQPVQAHWLLVPHHGSRSSSTPTFLAAVAPHSALLSRGRHNSFGHPHARVTARYRARDIALYDTAEHGAVWLELGRHGPARWLRAERRFWRQQAASWL